MWNTKARETKMDICVLFQKAIKAFLIQECSEVFP